MGGFSPRSLSLDKVQTVPAPRASSDKTYDSLLPPSPLSDETEIFPLTSSSLFHAIPVVAATTPPNALDAVLFVATKRASSHGVSSPELGCSRFTGGGSWSQWGGSAQAKSSFRRAVDASTAIFQSSSGKTLFTSTPVRSKAQASMYTMR